MVRYLRVHFCPLKSPRILSTRDESADESKCLILQAEALQKANPRSQKRKKGGTSRPRPRSSTFDPSSRRPPISIFCVFNLKRFCGQILKSVISVNPAPHESLRSVQNNSLAFESAREIQERAFNIFQSPLQQSDPLRASVHSGLSLPRIFQSLPNSFCRITPETQKAHFALQRSTRIKTFSTAHA